MCRQKIQLMRGRFTLLLFSVFIMDSWYYIVAMYRGSCMHGSQNNQRIEFEPFFHFLTNKIPFLFQDPAMLLHDFLSVNL